jgi:putative ABC transport system permease protein
MAIPLSYSHRNLWARKLTTLLTILGIALVSFVFAAVLMLANGLKKTLVSTGLDDNVIVIRKSATSDVLSIVSLDSARLVETFPEIALAADGKPVASKELVVIINLQSRKNDMANVIVRGVSANAAGVHRNVKIMQGRNWDPGKAELIVGRKIFERFRGCHIGEQLKFGSRLWTIVGVFEAGGSGFESEIWGDVEQMMSAFNRPVYSTITARLKTPGDFSAFRTRFQSETRLQQLDVKKEKDYYEEQSRPLAKFLSYLGLVITIIFSFGAMIGAMITMYASVANRTTEIGTLRALGFSRRSILVAFMVEALLISFTGGMAGVLLASALQTVDFSMLNFTSFSQLSFGFSLSTSIAASTMLFAAIMGVVGGLLPAVRAARLDIVTALRASS